MFVLVDSIIFRFKLLIKKLKVRIAYARNNSVKKNKTRVNTDRKQNAFGRKQNEVIVKNRIQTAKLKKKVLQSKRSSLKKVDSEPIQEVKKSTRRIKNAAVKG